MMTPRRFQLLSGALAVAASLALPGCGAGPLGDHDEDLGKQIALRRLRAVEPLMAERAKRDAAARPAEPAPSPQGAAPAMAGRLMGRPKLPLAIEDVRAATLQNNLDVRVAKVDPSIAAARLDAERAKFEVALRPSVNFSRNGFSPSTVDDIRSEVLTGELGVDVPLRTGGRVSVDLVGSRSNTEGVSSFFGSRPTNYGSGVEFSITQPLLRDAGVGPSTASIQIASYSRQMSEARTKLAVVSTLMTAERAYWRLYAVRRELDVRQQQYDLAQEQLARASRRVDAGQSPEVDRIRAESGLADRLEGIIVAENAVLIQQRELKRLMNSPAADLGDNSLVETTTQPDVVNLDPDPAALVSIGLDNRMELLEAELALLSDQVGIDLAKNRTLPRLDLTGAYGITGSGSDFGEAQREFLLRGRFNSFSVGLQGEIPLGNEAAQARYREAVLIRVQRLGSLEARRQLVRQEVLDAVDRLTANWQRVLAARQATILAGRTLRAEQRQYDVGARTSTDVLDAAARLADAQSSEIRAVTDYQVTLAELASATGTVLGAAQVEWSPEPSP